MPGQDTPGQRDGGIRNEMDMEHFANPSSSAGVAKCLFLEFVV